jgi:Mg-chelatase subunit ChlD
MSLMAEDIHTFTYTQKNLDVLFVLDYSNSMNANDKDKMALQMIEAFIDSAFSSKMRIGFVTYNHQILSYSAPSSIQTAQDRLALKNGFMHTRRSGSTDIGLALAYAYDLLDKDSDRESIIILLSDGESDLTYARTGRTIDDCNEDMVAVAQKCADEQIPIYTIAFGAKFDGSPASLQTLSHTTSAKSYVSNEPSGLVEIFNEILSTSSMSSILPIASSLSSGELQSIQIPTKDVLAHEANILVVSSTPIQEATILYPGSDLIFNKSNYYFTSKITNLTSDSIDLKIRALPNANVKVYLILYQDADFIIEIPNEIFKNKPFILSAYFWDNQKNAPIEKQSFYENLLSNVMMFDNNGSLLATPPITFEHGKWKSELISQNTGLHRLQYTLQSNSYNLTLENLTFKAENQTPEGSFEKELVYSTLHESTTFDLNEYFVDPNGDALTFELYETMNTDANLILQGSTLTIHPREKGNFIFKLKILDTEGGLLITEATTLKILPIWRYYSKIFLTIAFFGLAGVVLTCYILLQRKRNAPKPVFSGKIKAYFTKLPEEYTDIEPLSFSLYQMDAKELTLSQLLESANANVFNTENILFKPSLSKDLGFYHISQNSIMIGASIACKNIKYSLQYNHKIYITSPDGRFELELHYVSSRS